MIRALIVDDEPVARRGIRQQLRGADDVEVVGECGDGASAIEAIAELAPDLVFLDIQMPEVGGFEVVEAIGVASMPAVIFVTAYDEHALRAFDVHAVDYVLKPVDRRRFRTALERARQRLAQPTDARLDNRIAEMLAELGRPAPRHAKRLAIKGDGRVTLVDVGDVDRLEAAGNYVEVHVGARHHLLRETMANVEARLDPAQFVRVSRSSIVNAARVRELQPMFNGDFVIVLRDGTKISGSRRYRQAFDALTR
ncbi:MAG TPA: LytTR family DNA-binding domain-containing protein [Thermoanaerobaculia bacterium]|nr:LytTR family DNA-binding domain-containing protein [Thermoanaerobaculia bacterium]